MSSSAGRVDDCTMDPSDAMAAPGQLALMVIGLGPVGIEASLALAESARCCLSLVDDALADSQWRKSACCLPHQCSNGSLAVGGDAAESAGAGKAVTRSQHLASVLSSLIKRDVHAISPSGDASIVEDFKAVIVTDATLPHAIAFNEHARAVECGFFLAEGRGAVGRIFRDLGFDGCKKPSSHSLRRALLEPYFSTTVDLDDGLPPPSTTVTVGMKNAHRGVDALSLPRPWHNGTSGQEALSSACVREHTEGATGAAAAGLSHGRQAQFHVVFQALHVFWQEHGHLPIAFDLDQAHEIVRIAEEVVETAQKIPGNISWQPETIDVGLCCRMAAISRVVVPAVSFQLGGLVAAAALDYAEGRHYHERRWKGARGDHTSRSEGRSALGKERKPLVSQWGASDQWTFVDTSEIGLSDIHAGGCGLRSSESWNTRAQPVDPPSLKAWLGSDLSSIVSGARVALIGCGRLGRDMARCLLLSGACTGPRGRMVFIDHGGDALSSGTCTESGTSPSRAAAIRDLAHGFADSGRSKVSAFDGAVQGMDLEIDLWEGVDAVVVCAGRKEIGGGGGGGAREAGDRTRVEERGDCEALLRFVSHKCVLHAKPLVWGWAGGRGEGGAGVEVMVPGRTTCLVCRSLGGVQQLIKRRKAFRREAKLPPDVRVAVPQAQRDSVPIPMNHNEHDDGDESWHPRGNSFSVARSAVAGAAVAELFKALKPQCCREELHNWRLEIGRGSSSRSSSHGTRTSKYNEGNGGHERARPGNGFTEQSRGACRSQSLLIDKVQSEGFPRTIRPVTTTPDPPRTVVSTPFDPFTGDSLRAVPEGFTEWGVEDIRPSSMDQPDTPRSRHGRIDDPFSLRALVRIIFVRFGVEVKRVATAATGSECRMGAGRCFERGDDGREKVLWAEWEKTEESGTRQDDSRHRSVVSKMDLKVLSLWQQVWSRTPHDKERRRVPPGGKEPRFLFLDVGGVMGEENVVLPVLKYWVR